MGKNPLTTIIGIALAVCGLGLIYWGYQLADSVTSQITEAVTGAAPDKVMKFYIGGAVSLAVGIYLFLRK